MSKPVIFVATYPNEKQGYHPGYLDQLNDDYLVLHPSFNYEAEEGVAALAAMGNPELPESDNIWKRMLARDYWGIQQAKLLVFDVDAAPGDHFLAVGIIHQKLIVATSETLRGVTPYFSQYVEALVRPEKLKASLEWYLTQLNATVDLSAPQAVLDQGRRRGPREF